MEHGPPYFLWIKLNEAEWIKPSETKIVRLKYIERQESTNPSITVTPFGVEKHKLAFTKSANEDYDTFIQIAAPLGYKLSFGITSVSGSTQLQHSQIEGLYVNQTDEFTQIRIPPVSANTVFSIYYDISPPISERRFFKGTIIGLYIISGFYYSLLSSETGLRPTEASMKHFTILLFNL